MECCVLFVWGLYAIKMTRASGVKVLLAMFNVIVLGKWGPCAALHTKVEDFDGSV